VAPEEEAAHRLSLETEHAEAQAATARRYDGLAVGLLVALGLAASVVGISGNISVAIALAPPLLSVVAAAVGAYFAQGGKGKTKDDGPPRLAQISATLTRDRERIRHFSPNAREAGPFGDDVF
jgi:hypothetical protein